MDACILVSSLVCAHTYTPLPLFATLVSRIKTLAIPYDDCVVCVQVRLYSVYSHLALVSFDFRITSTFKQQLLS